MGFSSPIQLPYSEKCAMMRSKVAFGLMLSAALVIGTKAWPQANVNESLETAIIYVDVNHGSDSNSGAKGSPLKTIGAGAAMAVANNQAGFGTKVIIRPGIYREAVSLSFSGKDTSMPITFQASTPAKTVMSGADIWDGWTPTNGSPVYTHAWPYGWGLCPLDTGTSSDGTFH